MKYNRCVTSRDPIYRFVPRPYTSIYAGRAASLFNLVSYGTMALRANRLLCWESLMPFDFRSRFKFAFSRNTGLMASISNGDTSTGKLKLYLYTTALKTHRCVLRNCNWTGLYSTPSAAEKSHKVNHCRRLKTLFQYT